MIPIEANFSAKLLLLICYLYANVILIIQFHNVKKKCNTPDTNDKDSGLTFTTVSFPFFYFGTLLVLELWFGIFLLLSFLNESRHDCKQNQMENNLVFEH